MSDDLRIPPDPARTWKSRVVRPDDLIDLARPGVVVNEWIFERCVFKGPMVLVFQGNLHLTGTTFDLGGATPDSMFWEIEAGQTKLGAIVLNNCVIEDCELARVGIAGTSADVSTIRSAIGLPPDA